MGVAKLLALAGLGAVLAFGKAAAQERIADDFNLEETVDICMACHGEDGVPIEADIPVLWGQQFYYLYVQMKDYKAGRRANEIMQPMVEGFTRDQMKALATYFSEKTWPGMPAAKDADKAKAGSAQTGAGQCAQCHNTYMGDSRIPRLAGQQEAYLLRTMLEFKNKIRLNSAAKGSLMKSYEDTSLEQMAHFLATL
jgi:cytochrome c553